MYQITKRLLPGQDLRNELETIVKTNKISAGTLLSVVGSLTNLRLRVADGKTVQEWEKQFEIVSGTGTLSQDDCHIHISAADQSGAVIGGHLKDGCLIGTTAELVLLIFDDIEYKREPDPKTGYNELV